MSCIKSVVNANDLCITKTHEEFAKWRKRQMQTATGRSKSLFQWALQHYNTCKRTITRNCETFQSPKSYARAIVTTFVSNKKAFWQHPQHPGWKQAGRKPPPETRNGAPMRVLYTNEREDVYKFVLIFV